LEFRWIEIENQLSPVQEILLSTETVTVTVCPTCTTLGRATMPMFTLASVLLGAADRNAAR
jgi:hypothetical protein